MVPAGTRSPAVSVLHVLAPAPVGGLEAVVPGLTLGARGSAVEARVAAVIPPGELDHTFLAPFRNAGVEAFTIEVSRRGYLQERAGGARLCKPPRPEVALTHGSLAVVVDAPQGHVPRNPQDSPVPGFQPGE